MWEWGVECTKNYYLQRNGKVYEDEELVFDVILRWQYKETVKTHRGRKLFDCIDSKIQFFLKTFPSEIEQSISESSWKEKIRHTRLLGHIACL